jgi:integrase
MKGHIRKRGKDSWAVVIELDRTPDGHRKQKWHTVRGDKRDAERELARLLNDVATGEYVEPSRMTVAEFLEQWLETYANSNVTPRTYERYQEIVRLHLIPALGSSLLTKLTPLQIQTHYAKSLQAGRKDGKKGGLSPTTVLQHHRVLHKALECAVLWQIIGRNVADAVQPPRRVRREMQTLDAEQVRKLLQEAEKSEHYSLIYVAVNTGLRMGELLGLKWEDLDFAECTAQIRRSMQRIAGGGMVASDTKTHRSRRSVSLQPTVMEVLKTHKVNQARERLLAGEAYVNNALVFATPLGAPVDPSNLSKAFRRLLKSARLPRVRFHDLRHTHASLMLKAGVHPKIVSERLGHSAIGITLDTYSHVLPNLQKEAARKLDEQLFGPPESKERQGDN